MKRTFWAGLGYTVGIGTSVYVQRRLRRTVDRYAPKQVREDVTNKGRAAAERARGAVIDLRDAAQDGVAAMRDERRDLLAEFTADEALHTGSARGLGRPADGSKGFRPLS